jgi:hypothetical protein
MPKSKYQLSLLSEDEEPEGALLSLSGSGLDIPMALVRDWPVSVESPLEVEATVRFVVTEGGVKQNGSGDNTELLEFRKGKIQTVGNFRTIERQEVDVDTVQRAADNSVPDSLPAEWEQGSSEPASEPAAEPKVIDDERAQQIAEDLTQQQILALIALADEVDAHPSIDSIIPRAVPLVDIVDRMTKADGVDYDRDNIRKLMSRIGPERGDEALVIKEGMLYRPSDIGRSVVRLIR